MGSDDREDAPQPSGQRDELPRLRIFRFPGGKPPGADQDPEPNAAGSAHAGRGPADSTDSADQPDAPADSDYSPDYSAPGDEPDYLDATELADDAEHRDSGSTDSTRTGGTRPIQVNPAPVATGRPTGWDAAATPPATPPPAAPAASPGSPASPPEPGARRRSRGPLIAGGVAIVLVLGILAWFLVGGIGGDEDGPEADTKPTDSAAPTNAEPVTPADWTKRVCAAVTAWNAETGDLPSKLTGLLDQDSDDLQKSLADGYESLTDAAQTLSGGIGSAEAPEIDGSRPAAQQLTEMVEQVIDDVAQGRSDVTQMDDGEGPESGPPAQELVTEFGQVVETPSGTLREVIFNAEPELHDVFAADPGCGEFV